MWQSEHARPFPPRSLRLRSLNAARPRATLSHSPSPQLSLVAPFPCARVIAVARMIATRHTLAANATFRCDVVMDCLLDPAGDVGPGNVRPFLRGERRTH